jgi:hypothetical protein
MKPIVYLLLFYMYYFMIAGFIWFISPYEFGEITSFPPVIVFAGVLSVVFAGYTVLDLKEKGKL